MKTVRYFFAGLFCSFVAMSGQSLAQTGHEAEHAHGKHEITLTLDHGKKWPTDEPLRNGMETLRAAYAEQLDAIHQNELSAEGYKLLGEKTSQAVGDIVAQCKLEPEADAMLHLIIADMLAGADIMTRKAQDNPRGGAHKVVMALQNYGRYFDHPGWKNLE